MADPLLLTLLASFKEELITTFQFSKDELKHLIEDGLQEYMATQHSKIARVKTFIYRNEPVDFYQTFFPLNLEGWNPIDKDFSISIEQDIKQIFSESPYISILGDAGSGKSMLIKHIFLSFLRQESEIPIYIELRNLNLFEGSFQDYIEQTIFNNRLSPNSRILERLLSSGKFLFLLDGYDELRNDGKHKRTDELNRFIDKYRKNYFLITSRPGANLEPLPRFYNYNVAPIRKDQIESFTRQQLSIVTDGEIWVNHIMKVIQDPNNEDYKQYMANPLLLSMFIFTFKNYPEVPHTKSKFYFNVFDTLCTRHDTLSKSGDLHERKTRLKSEEFQKILEYFSYRSYFEGKFSFARDYLITQLNRIKTELNYEHLDTEDLIYDLTVSIAIIMIDGTEYKFPHRSLQEYFTAQLIARQPESVKLRIYQTQYTKFVSEYKNFNLWRLSVELDPCCFKKFMLYTIREEIIQIQAPTFRQTILNCLHHFDFIWIGPMDMIESHCGLTRCFYYLTNSRVIRLSIKPHLLNRMIKTPEIKKFVFDKENAFKKFQLKERHIIKHCGQFYIRFHKDLEILYP